MFKLIIEDDEGKTTIVPLIRDEITVGRKEGNTIRLTERNVSRRHARLTRVNGQIFIEDLNSYNGVKVNGDRIHGRLPIREGDEIHIGDYKLALQVDHGVTGDDVDLSTHSSTAVIRVEDIKPPESSKEVKAVPLDHVCKLVVLNTELKGREYLLTATDMVIGRVDGCDIAIDHRSISRNHSRITWDGRAYFVVDLNSANGVRVNDEEYGRVELHRGDVIELGHVKFRFVGQQETAAALPDSSHEERKRSPSAMIFGVAGAAFLLVGVVVWLTWHSGKGPEETRPEVSAVVGHHEAAPAITLEDAQRVFDERKWEETSKLCLQYKADHPDDPRTDELLRKAKYEYKNYQKFSDIQSAISLEEFDRALYMIKELQEDSIYYRENLALFADVKRKAFKKHTDLATQYLEEGECDKATKEVQEILFHDENHQEAKRLSEQSERCASKRKRPKVEEPAPAVAVKPKAPKAPKGPKAPKVVPEPVQPKAPEKGSVDEGGGDKRVTAKELFEKGRGQFITGNFSEAERLLKQSTKLVPKFAAPYKILGMIYGRQGKVDEMIRMYQIFIRLNPRDSTIPQLKKIIDNYHKSKGG